MITCIDCGKEVERTGMKQKRCPDCAKQGKAAWKRRWRAENPEAAAEYGAKYRAENRQVLRERSAKYEAENRHARRKPRVRRRVGKYHPRDPDASKNYKRQWKQENPDRDHEYKRKARARDSAIEASRRHSKWTDAEDALVLSWTEGDRELGAVLGRSRNSVGQRRRDLRKRSAAQPASSEGERP